MLAYDVASASQIGIELNAVKRLWLEAFSEDDEAAFDSYCQGRLIGARCFVYIYQHELASMAFSITSDMVGANNCSSKNIGFVVGVATAKKWRGHHFASQILQTIAKQAQNSGCHCLLLSTYIPQFYAKLGYQEAAWHKLWRWRGSVTKCQNSRCVFLCSDSDLLVLSAYYQKRQQYGWLERSFNYWRWRLKDADTIYVAKDSGGNIFAYAIFNKDNQCEELLSNTSQGASELIKTANFTNSLEIGSLELNAKLQQDKNFENVGLGSCQMILPLSDRFKDEYCRNGVNFCCLDNW